MNIENFSYTLLATLLGMGVVFLFLSVMCVVMILMKKFIGREKKEVSVSAPAGEAVSAKEKSSESNEWIAAAVAAYIEEDEEPVSALSWIPGEELKYDSWASSPRVAKRFSGVR